METVLSATAALKITSCRLALQNFTILGTLMVYRKMFLHEKPPTFDLTLLLIMSAAYIQMPFRLVFVTEANTINPDQTDPKEHIDIGPYCLQYRLPK